MELTQVGLQKRFDHHYRAFQQDGALMHAHIQRGIKEFRLAKTCAYRMARSYLAMIRKDQAKFVDLVMSSGQTTDAWLDSWFEPLRVVDADYRALLTAVAKGMKLKNYLAMTPGIFLAQQNRRPLESAAVPCIPDVELSVAERLEQWMARARELELQLRDERRLRREADRRVADLGLAVKRLHRILDKVAV